MGILKLLEWDSNFFGIQMANFNAKDIVFKKSLDEEILLNQVSFIQSIVDISELNLIHQLEKYGFSFADQKTTFYKKLENKIEILNLDYEIASADEINELKQIACGIYEDSRYNAFSHIFPPYKVDEFYGTWIEKSVRGEFDDVCLIIRDKKEIAGFITLKFKEDIASIGLIGVRTSKTRTGYGSKLLNSAYSYIVDRRVFKVQVATQGRNINALNFYIRNGFSVLKIEHWYYLYKERY